MLRYKSWVWAVVGVIVVILLLLWWLGGSQPEAAPGVVPAGEPAATGQFVAGPLAPELAGRVDFYAHEGGTFVSVQLEGLPLYSPADIGVAPVGPHGFHVHEHGACEVGEPEDPFDSSGGHWNPDEQPHGNHAGDFPVLFSQQGSAQQTFVTNRFSPEDVVGLSVVVHQNPDDFRTQPAGDSGLRLGCAVITAL